MNTYRKNSLMAGLLYIFGTVFGVLSAIFGGKVISSGVVTQPLEGLGLLDLIVTDSSKLLLGAFFILLMGICLVAVTVFLYPIFKKDSEELAMGMIMFRGVMEGVYYFIATLGFIVLFAVGQEYLATGANATVLQSAANIVYKFQDLLGPIGAILFLIGATCLYISFYRTKLIPRWLTIWGFVGVVPYMAYAILHLFGLDTGFGFYLQMILAPQEIVMGLWLVIVGFNKVAMNKLVAKNQNT